MKNNFIKTFYLILVLILISTKPISAQQFWNWDEGKNISCNYLNQVVTDFLFPIPLSTILPTLAPEPIIQVDLSSSLDTWFAQYARQYQVDQKLIKYIAQRESGFNTQAVNQIYGGLYQFTHGAWSRARDRMGLDNNPDLRFNPEEAIKTAAFKISQDGAGAWPVCQHQ